MISDHEIVEDHEVRLRQVEIWKERATGVITAIGLMSGGALTVLGALLASGRLGH